MNTNIKKTETISKSEEKKGRRMNKTKTESKKKQLEAAGFDAAHFGITLENNEGMMIVNRGTTPVEIDTIIKKLGDESDEVNNVAEGRAERNYSTAAEMMKKIIPSQKEFLANGERRWIFAQICHNAYRFVGFAYGKGARYSYKCVYDEVHRINKMKKGTTEYEAMIRWYNQDVIIKMVSDLIDNIEEFIDKCGKDYHKKKMSIEKYKNDIIDGKIKKVKNGPKPFFDSVYASRIHTCKGKPYIRIINGDYFIGYNIDKEKYVLLNNEKFMENLYRILDSLLRAKNKSNFYNVAEHCFFNLLYVKSEARPSGKRKADCDYFRITKCSHEVGSWKEKIVTRRKVTTVRHDGSVEYSRAFKAPIEWYNSFKGIGAYWYLHNGVTSHDFNLHVEDTYKVDPSIRGKRLNKEQSLVYLEYLAAEKAANGEGYALFAYAMEVMKRNGYNYETDPQMIEYREEKEAKKKAAKNRR